jgi:hypothetical protein
MSVKKIMLYLSTFCLLLFNVNNIKAQQQSSNIQSLILDDFELGQDGKPARYWTLIPDRFGREGTVDSGKSLQDLKFVKSWPEQYFGKEIPEKKRGEFFYGTVQNDETTKKYTDFSGSCLGLKLSFNRQGYNHVDLVPLASVNGKYEADLVPFRGKVRQVDFYVWGANYNYYMEMVVMDYKGIEHRLDVGSIRHIGWKNFIVEIPNYIPQSTTYISKIQTLRLVKLVVWTYPQEKVTGAYVYIDQIKYLTDVSNTMYDGYELGNPDKIKDLWDKGAAAPNESDIIQ